MSDSPLFLLGKLTAKFERLDDLLAELKAMDHFQTRDRILVQWERIEDTQSHIDAELERLVGLYSQPMHLIKEIADEERNKYMDFTKELIPEKPESLR